MTFTPHNLNANVSTELPDPISSRVENLEGLEHMSRDVEWGDEIVKHDIEVLDRTIDVPNEP